MTTSVFNSAKSKAELRRKIHAKVKIELKPGQRHVQAWIIFHKLIQHLKYRSAKQISIYCSTEHEVDTVGILRHALEHGKRCFIPYVDENRPAGAQGARMMMVEIKSMPEYAKLPFDRWGIKSLTAAHMTDREIANPMEGNLDLAIVPGIAFTKDGQRLGKGKGYYDEFLSDWYKRSPKPLYTIGLAFQEQIVDNVFAVDGSDFVLSEVFSAQ